MSPNHRFPEIRLIVVFLMLASLALPTALGAPLDGEEEVVQVIELRHLDTASAVTILRTIYNARHVAELPDRRMIVYRDAASTVEEVLDLIKQVDVPARAEKSARASAARQVGEEEASEKPAS